MALRVFMLVFLVPNFFTSTSGKVKDWHSDWSWSNPKLSDDEIVELLYKDPDRLRDLTSADYDHHEGFDVSQEISIPGIRTDKKPDSDLPSEFESEPDTFGKPEKTFEKPNKVLSRPGVAYSRAENTFLRPTGGYRYPQNSFNVPGKIYQRPESPYNRPTAIPYLRPENLNSRPTANSFDRPESPFTKPTANTYKRPENPYNRPTPNTYNRPETPYTPSSPYRRPESPYNRPDNNFDVYRRPYTLPTADYQVGSPITLRSPPLARRIPGKATSYTSVQHYSPKKGKPGPAQNLLSYSQHIIHHG